MNQHPWIMSDASLRVKPPPSRPAFPFVPFGGPSDLEPTAVASQPIDSGAASLSASNPQFPLPRATALLKGDLRAERRPA